VLNWVGSTKIGSLQSLSDKSASTKVILLVTTVQVCRDLHCTGSRPTLASKCVIGKL